MPRVRTRSEGAETAPASPLALLRRLEREPPGSPLHHRLPAPVHARLTGRPDWLAELARRTGVTHLFDSL